MDRRIILSKRLGLGLGLSIVFIGGGKGKGRGRGRGKGKGKGKGEGEGKGRREGECFLEQSNDNVLEEGDICTMTSFMEKRRSRIKYFS